MMSGDAAKDFYWIEGDFILAKLGGLQVRRQTIEQAVVIVGLRLCVEL
jgi:hypothetical protein